MTLRGVGPYVRGSRIEFRPVTILCGKNGSGKSTWFKTLNLLHDSHRAGLLPFALASGGPFGEYTNAFLRWAATEDSQILSDPAEAAEYGGLGTIGLEFLVEEMFQVGEPIDSPFASTPADMNLVDRFLWHGECARGLRIRLRFAHLDSMLFEEIAPFVEHAFELCLNETYLLTATRPHDDSLRARVDGAWEPAANYTVRSSPAFLGNWRGSSSLPIPIAEISPPNDGRDWRVLPRDGDEAAAAVCRATVRRIGEVLDRFFSGFFYLNAIREPLRDSRDEPHEPSSRRYIGPHAEAAFEAEREYAYNRFTVHRARSRNGTRLGPEDAVVREALASEPSVFEGWVSAWLERLVETRITLNYEESDGRSLGDPWSAAGLLPVGTLEDARPAPVEGLLALDETRHNLDRFMHGCLGLDGSYYKRPHPDRLSTGFHQVFPMVVQAGLMFPNEAVAIENPEAHLHPSLQLDVAGFLLTQALQKKLVLIETHSDLIVRRMLRAVLEEELPQEQVRIYFSKLDERENGYRSSSVERLRVDRRGRVDNWPEGFMDEDVREARRLLDAMYGGNAEDEEP